MYRFAALLIFTLCFITDLTAQKAEESRSQSINKYVEQLRGAQAIPGISLAILKDGEVIHQQHYGVANLPHQAAVTDETIYRVYSLTKVITSVAVFQLVDAGKLELNAGIGTYLEDLPEAWQSLTVAELLAHASGLPDMKGDNPYELMDLSETAAKDRVYSLPMQHAAGSKFDYNQTNYWLLKRIVEQVSGQPFSEYVGQRQFAERSSAYPLFTSDSREIIIHRATPYFPFLKGRIMTDLPYANGDYFIAGNGLQLTLQDFIAWSQRFENGELISKAAQKQLLSPFPYTATEDQFAYGLDILPAVGRPEAYGFSGSMCTMYRTYPATGITVIYLSNGFGGFYNLGKTIDHLAELAQ